MALTLLKLDAMCAPSIMAGQTGCENWKLTTMWMANEYVSIRDKLTMVASIRLLLKYVVIHYKKQTFWNWKRQPKPNTRNRARKKDGKQV